MTREQTIEELMRLTGWGAHSRRWLEATLTDKDLSELRYAILADLAAPHTVHLDSVEWWAAENRKLSAELHLKSVENGRIRLALDSVVKALAEARGETE